MMMIRGNTAMSWQLQEAKNKFSQVVKDAQDKGPQRISVRGRDTAVLLSLEAYQQLTQRQDNLADFLLQSPMAQSGLEIPRDEGLGRDVAL